MNFACALERLVRELARLAAECEAHMAEHPVEDDDRDALSEAA